jgi:hypothetical protein
MLAILVMLLAPLGCGQLKPDECNDAPYAATLLLDLNSSTALAGDTVLGTVLVTDDATSEPMNYMRVTITSIPTADGTSLQFYYADGTPASSTFDVCTDKFGTYTFSIGTGAAVLATISAYSGAHSAEASLTVTEP